MASNLPTSTIVRTCFNCGDPGHFARWCPHRQQGVNPSNALVPTASTPLLTLPSSSSNSNVGVVATQYKNTGWYDAKQRLIILESTVAEMKIRRDAEIEREKTRKEEEEKKQKEKEEEERRSREKKDREEFQAQMMETMNSRMDKMDESINKKNGGDAKSEVETLRKEVERLQKLQIQGASSSTVAKNTDNGDLICRMLREQEAMKVRLEEAASMQRKLDAMVKEVEALRHGANFAC
ncbi:hypothetical protein CBR_g4782 [Chara braunii]|uniref:CCHC-type domain-containing protein n=1 Tax=Chara braunii TaxID=69332 RepID=A0A388KIS4_CHABU|nr:hypothetical protein CBR_g4782 [Chara braunii]|eukprot:GBG69955.1 hypothetical protein CBR_g4782 [Chara braunii]